MPKQTALDTINRLIAEENSSGATRQRTGDAVRTINQLIAEEEENDRRREEERQRQQRNAASATEAMDLVRTYGDYGLERRAAEQPQPVKEERRVGNALTPEMEARYQQANGVNRAPTAYQTYMMQVANAQPVQEETRSTDELRRDMNRQNRIVRGTERMAADMGNQLTQDQSLLYNPTYTSNLRTMGQTMEAQQNKAAAATNLYQTLSVQRREQEEREKYSALMQNPDFAAKSQGDPAIGRKVSATSLSPAERLYQNIYNHGGEKTNAKDRNAAEFVSDEEAGIFFYLWNTQGPRAAQSYYNDYVDNRASQRRAEEAQRQAEAFGHYDVIGSSAESVVANFASGVGLVDMAWQNIARSIGLTDKNKPLNYYSSAQLPGLVSDAIRKGAADELAEMFPKLKIGKGENAVNVASFLYQTGMSMADSGVAVLLNTIGIPEAATLANMGAAAGTRAIRDARERGATDGQALAFGISSAIMEALFEKISLDRILEPSYAQTAKAHFLNALKQSFTEGSEEVMTTLANTAMDQLIMGDKSELFTRQRQLMEQGVSEKEALGAAFKQLGTEIVGDLLGGMISGFGMGGAKEAYSGIRTGVQNLAQDYQLARTINDAARQEQKTTPVEAAPQMQAPVNESQQNQNARQADPLGYAMNKAQGGETVTLNDARAIIENPQALQALRDTGVLTEEVQAGKEGRQQVKAAVEALAYNEARSALGISDSFANTQPVAQERKAATTPVQAAKEETRQAETAPTAPVPQRASESATESGLRITAAERQNTPPVPSRLTIGAANGTLNENRQEGNNNVTVQEKAQAASDSSRGDFATRARIAAAGRQGSNRSERASGVGRLLEDLRTTQAIRGAKSRASQAGSLRTQAEAGNQREVSAKDLGIQNGTDAKTARLLTNDFAAQHLGKDWTRAVEAYAARGVKLQAMTGQLQKQTPDGVSNIRAYVSGDGKTITVQADHPALTWNQLLDHEELHRRIKEDASYKKEVEDALLADENLKPQLADIIDRYYEAYRAVDSSMTSEDIYEELLADYRAGFDMLDPLGLKAETRAATKAAAKDIRAVEKNYTTNGGKPAPEGVTENFAEGKNSVEPPYRRGTAALTRFEESLSPEARKTYDLFNKLNNISNKGTAVITVGSGKAAHLKRDTIADKSFFAKDWNNYVKNNEEFAAVARELVAALPKSVKDFGHFNDDGTVTPTEFEEKFKMNRSFIQRVVDALPKNVVQPVMNIDGHEYRISDKPISGAVGGEEYRQAIIAEKRRLYKEGNLPTVSTGSLSHDNWGAMGFLATNTKTGASGDFTTFCPQMYFNNGCFYCYRRAALTSGSNNKLTGETVWYSGEILQLRPSDVGELNKKGGLRIQSFGDWQDMYTPMLADMLYDAQLKGLQIKIITKEPSMIETVAKLRQQALGLSLYFNLSADYTIERRGESDNRETKNAAPLNAERPFIEHEWLTGEPGEDIGWKRALTVQEANEYRKKYSWVNTRIVATTLKEYIRGLIDPTVDVVTGYHGKIKYQERVSSETGETLIEVEALGDSGMPQFVRDEKTGEWSIARDKEGRLLNGKNRYQKALCDAIIARGLQEAYYTKACCITGHCEKCQGQCGAYANKMSTKNARNRDPDNLRWVYAQMEMHPGAGMENSQLFAENLEDTEGLTQAEDLVDIYDREHGIEPLQEKSAEQALAERDKWLKKKDREAAKKAAKAAAEKAGATPAQVEANGKYSTEVNTITYFSGGGLVDYALRDVIGSSMAVEFDKGAAAVYALNNGDVFVGDVRDFSKNELDKMQGIEYFHASPVCKNYSRMNTKRADVSDNDTDITTAQATADAIRRLKPKVFTLEQVPGYKGSKAYNIIADTLTELGYAWDDTVAKASDYGGATSRERLMLRAVRDGALPALPEKVKGYSWFEATADLIDGLNTADRISPFLQERINATPELQRALANQTEPILILGGTPGGKAWWASANEPSPSITTDMTDSRIIMPDGTIKKPDARFYARIMGLPDSYQFTQYRGKDNQTQGQKVIGNGVPVQLTQKFFGNLLDDALDTGVKYSLEVDMNNELEDKLTQFAKAVDAPQPFSAPDMLASMYRMYRNGLDNERILGPNADIRKARILADEIDALIGKIGERRESIKNESVGDWAIRMFEEQYLKPGEDLLEGIHDWVKKELDRQNDWKGEWEPAALQHYNEAYERTDFSDINSVKKFFKDAEAAFKENGERGIPVYGYYDEEHGNSRYSTEISEEDVGTTLRTAKGSPIKRSSKYGVGKEIGGSASIEIDPEVAAQFSPEGVDQRQVKSLIRENEQLKKDLKRWKAQVKTSDRTQPREEDVRRMANDLLKSYKSNADKTKTIDSLRELAHTAMSNDTSWTDVHDQAVRLAGEIIDYAFPSDGGEEDFTYSAYLAEATEILANDIIDRVIGDEIRQAPTTYADRAEERIARATLKGELRVQKVMERLEAERERRREQVAEVKEHYKSKEAQGRENRAARELRTKIINHAKQMTTELLKPTDKKHVPESLRKSVAAVLSAIDLGSGYDMTAGQDGKTLRVGRGTEGAEQTKRTKAFLELREALLKEADGLVLDPELLGTVEEPGNLTRLVTELADVPIANMNTEQLQVVYDALRGIEGAVRSANRMLSSARWAAVGEAADAIRSENGNKGPVLQLAGAAGRVQDLTRLDMLTPEGYFHRLGKSGQAVFKMLRGAQDQFITNMTKATNDTQKIVGDTDVGALEKEKHTVTMGGEKVTMTTAQIMELYCLMQRDQGLQHITTGGIMVEPVRQGIKQTTQAEPLHPSMEELLDAVRLLTPDQIRLADAMQDYLSKDMAELGNEATLAVYGYKKFGQESKYWKIRSNKNEIQQSIEKETQTTSVANRGFTKAVNPNANTSVKIGSIFDTYSQSVNDMATYAAWLAVGEDVNRIRNYVFKDSEGQRTGTVKGILDRVIGSGGANYLQRLLADIANGAGMDDAGLTSGFVGAYKAAAIGANIRVIIQQPTAILRAAEMIDPKYLAAGLKNPMRAFERAKEYSPIAQWKDWGYFDINTGRKMKDVLFENPSKLEKVRQVSMAMAGKADSFAWGQLWGAVEAETKAKTDLKPGAKEFYEACAERFNDIIDHTQVVDGILQRSQIMRSKNAITRMAVSFMSEPTKQYNQFMSAVYDYRHSGDKKKAKQMLARTTFSMLAAGVMNVLAQSIVDALRNGDRERKYWEKLLQAFLGYNPDDDTFGEKFKTFAFSNMGELINPATYLPYAKDIMSIIQGYSVERMDMDGLSDTITAITRLAKALNGEGKQTVGYSLGKAIEQGAKLLGLSAYNVDRDLTALITTIANDADMPVLQYYLNRYRYRPGDNLSKELKGILWDARQKNDGSYDIIVEHLLKDGYTQEQIDAAVMNRLSDESGFTEARKAADAEGNNNGSYDLSETLEALENTTLSEEDRDVLLEAKLSDKQYGNYTTLLQYSDYDTWLSVMREMPANLSQAKIEAVLDKRDDLTTEQKAAYWQVLSGSKSAKNNPYSQEIGAEILNAKAENEPDKEPEKVAQMRITLSGLGLQDSKVDALAPVLGGDGSNTSKWRAVANQNLGKDQQDAVLKSVMTDAMYRNWTIASGENISLDSYVKGREAYVDLDNSGTDQNSEWTAALEKVTFDKDTTRNNYIKGVLWQIYTGSTSTKNNPYDKEAGQKVLDAKASGGGGDKGKSYAPSRVPALRIPAAPKVTKPGSGLRIRPVSEAAPRTSSGLRLRK